jgi:hypothetical protein
VAKKLLIRKEKEKSGAEGLRSIVTRKDACCSSRARISKGINQLEIGFGIIDKTNT